MNTTTIQIEVFRTDAALAADPQLLNLRARLARDPRQRVVATRIAYRKPPTRKGRWVVIAVDLATKEGAR